MGWWPLSFGPSGPPSAPTSDAGSSPSPLLPPTTSSTPSPAPSKPPTREQEADAELEAFLASLEGPSRPKATPSSAQPPSPPTSQPPPPPSSPWTSLWSRAPSSPPHPTDDPIHPSAPSTDSSTPAQLDISPRALRPRTMSCRAAFDSAFYCASLGGKFNDIYRFGTLQPCSEHWDAFWFCMRNRSVSGDTSEEKGERIADYYEAREGRERTRRAGGRSSEDVWELRTEPVERAFWKVP